MFVPSIASAGLSGDASLTYSSYDGSAKPVYIRYPDGTLRIRNADGSIRIADGSERYKVSSSSLVQDYSLLYSSSGPIYNNRVGNYDVALGYNWSSLDTSFKSSTSPTDNYDEVRGHLLYKGEVLLDPKEVPFRFTAYSRDMRRNSFLPSGGNYVPSFSSVFGSNNLATNINDGIHIETGATLIAGVKNGMTNGYNEVLRHFPMILIDYKNSVNRDVHSVTPVDDRLSRLAFVSLNKKDNWFHYRHTTYEDYLNDRNNYVLDEFQLGTVDQYMARRWIDFSNWLKVSTDIMTSKQKKNNLLNATEDINLNLFVIGERSNWNARTFTTFNRYKDEDNKLSYQSRIPLYLAGVVSKDISWNARTAFSENHDIDANGARSNFTNMLAGYRVDAYRQSPFNLSQSFDVESSLADKSDVLTFHGSLGTFSTPRFSRDLSLGASYDIKNVSTSVTDGSPSNFIEQNMNMIAGYAISNTLRFEARQTNAFTRGNFAPFSASTRDSSTQLSQYVAPRSISASQVGSQSFRSLSGMTISWMPRPRLNGSISLNEDIYRTDVIGIKTVTELVNSASYDNEFWTATNLLKYTKGNKETLDNNSDNISNSTSLRYIHSRNLDASVSAAFASGTSNGTASRSTDLEQRANYYYFSRAGVARKLFEINETLNYWDGTESSGRMFNKSLMLGFKYYPIRQLTLASGFGYAYSNSIREYTIVWNASVSANFRLLQASLDYSHGIRKSDGAVEDKFTGNIRKSF